MAFNEIVFKTNDTIRVLRREYEIRIGYYPEIIFAGPNNRGACLEGVAIYLHPDATLEDFLHELTHAMKYEILREMKGFIEDIMYDTKGGE